MCEKVEGPKVVAADDKEVAQPKGGRVQTGEMLVAATGVVIKPELDGQIIITRSGVVRVV